MPDDNPAAISRMLKYMYTQDYDDKEDTVIITTTGKTDACTDRATKDSRIRSGNSGDGGATDITTAHDVAVAYNNLGVYLVAEK